jgi:hypothetical protein
MRSPARHIHLLLLFAAALLPVSTWAEKKQTVCTITINSADEQKAFRRFLPASKYDFVELVERGRKDWLRSSCEAKVSCDVLIISGHHGEGNVFFSDSLEINEYLPIEELERVSCSDSCPQLFANLKEVYLFGCNTLNPQAQQSISPEIERGYQREGRSPTDAAKLARLLGQQRGESSRDRMRLVFRDVPVIYGFSSVAPLGPVAAVSLNRYFQSTGPGEVGKGHASAGLLRSFSQNGMVATRGMSTGDPLTPMRRDVCTFADDRPPLAAKVDSVHDILRRPAPESRMLLERIEHFTQAIDSAKRQQPEVAQALDRISGDADARERFLAFARDADTFPVRARMIGVARDVGWLTADGRRDELVRMLGDMLARKDVAASDVNLACTLNKEHELDGALERLATQAGNVQATGKSAVLACMGSSDARSRVLKALVSPADADVQIAQAYLRHRPIADAGELRDVTKAIAAMNAPEPQARALDALAHHYLTDRDSLDTLKQLFAKTRSPAVQHAIVGVLIRADRRSVAAADVLPTLREYRLKTSPGDTLVNSLIERLQETS